MHHETKIIICTKMKQKEDFNPHILCTSKHSRPTRTSHGTKHLVQSVNQASRHTHRINPTQKRRLAFSIVFPLEFEPLVFRLRKCLVNVRDFLFLVQYTIETVVILNIWFICAFTPAAFCCPTMGWSSGRVKLMTMEKHFYTNQCFHQCQHSISIRESAD